MHVALWALAVIALVVPALEWLVMRKNFHDAPDLADEPPLAEDVKQPSLLVIVPARDEAANIGDCVRGLLASRVNNLRVRVVDDGSTDRTPAIVEELAAGDNRLQLMRAPPLPAGWLGKSHALACGAEGADAEYVCFVDADVRAQPDALGRTLAVAERRQADLVTVLPRIDALGFWELAAQVLIARFIIETLPAGDVNRPDKSASVGIGPFLFFRRSAYLAIGGHASVKGEVVEDFLLAQRIKRAGLRLVYLRGVRQLSVRMYDSLGGIVRGYTKNFHAMVPPWIAPLAAAVVLAVVAGPWVVPPLALALGMRLPALLALGGLVLSLGLRIDLSRCYRLTGRAPWLAPLGALVLAWILLAGAWRHLRRRPVAWKGRAV